MLRLALLLCLPAAAMAADRWAQFASGPFEVWTEAGARSGRETLARFEQFRHALGQIVGEADLQTAVPVRILVFKTRREPAVVRGRDRWAVVLTANSPVPPAVFRDCARLLLESTARMPESIERGLLALFSTLEVTGIRITLGRPVPPEERTKEWARVHLLAVDPEYYGKLRVLIYNLRRGVAEDAAYRNAFGKSPAEIERQVERYLATGDFQTTDISSQPMNPERDLPEKPLESAAVRLAIADLLAGEASRNAYESMIREKIHVAESWEGLGLLALRDKQPDAARAAFSKAIEAGTQNAGAFIEYARLEPENAKAVAALEKAAKLNPKLAEPHFLMALRESDPARRIARLKTAATLNPRDASYWQALAEAHLAQHEFGEAAKAWRAAEQAATGDEQRARMRQARLDIERQRLDYEAAERKRIADEKQREIDRLKAEALAEVRALEAKYNRGSKPEDKAVPWWDGPKPSGRAQGALTRVDCLGRQARLVIQSEDRKITQLLVPDPTQIAIMGGGEQTLGCGPQKSRRVVVEYFPKMNPKLATSGEVATIEFQQ